MSDAEQKIADQKIYQGQAPEGIGAYTATGHACANCSMVNLVELSGSSVPNVPGINKSTGIGK